MRDVEGLQRHLDPLRARGARIAVDDAGEGYAGLQQVMSMRADIIKLDRALVADVHADPAKIALIGSLVHFARSTGASICAEGIETLAELRVLIHLGVATGQGWALARPGAPWPEVDPEAARVCAASCARSSPRSFPSARRGAPDGRFQDGDARRGSGRCSSARPRSATSATSSSCSKKVCRTIGELLGYGAVVVNVYRPAFDDMLTAAAVSPPRSSSSSWWAGPPPRTPGTRSSPRGSSGAGGVLRPRRGVRLGRAGRGDRRARHRSPTDDPDAWSAEDALFVPLRDSTGELIGVVSVDEPHTGRRPSDEQLDALVAIAGHAALALRIAQGTANDAQHQRMLESVLEVSAQLAEADGPDDVLQAVCDGIQDALGFDKVVIELAEEPGARWRRLPGAAGRSMARPLPRHDARGDRAPLHDGVRGGGLLPDPDRGGRGAPRRAPRAPPPR